MGEVTIALGSLTVDEANDIEIKLDKDKLYIHDLPKFWFDIVYTELPEAKYHECNGSEWIELRNVDVVIFRAYYDGGNP